MALEALRGELTTVQLATKHGIHQTMVSEWKKQAVEGLTTCVLRAIGGAGDSEVGRGESREAARKIGQLLVEQDFLAKASGR